MKDSNSYKLVQAILLQLLLKFCGQPVKGNTMEYVNNDFFQHMSAQLYTSTLEGSDGYLNSEQIAMVNKFVDNKWDGTLEHFDELFSN